MIITPLLFFFFYLFFSTFVFTKFGHLPGETNTTGAPVLPDMTRHDEDKTPRPLPSYRHACASGYALIIRVCTQAVGYTHHTWAVPSLGKRCEDLISGCSVFRVKSCSLSYRFYIASKWWIQGGARGVPLLCPNSFVFMQLSPKNCSPAWNWGQFCLQGRT